jgi:class 3 adenylate cyclase
MCCGVCGCDHRDGEGSYETCVLFADVSGFTALTEALSVKGPEGAEQLAKHLNSYFEQLVRLIAAQGGDVFKFAGSFVLVLCAVLVREGM